MTFSPTVLRTTGSATLVLALFTLTACANPVEQLTQGAVEGLIEQQTGGKIDLDDGGLSITTEDGNSIDYGSAAQVPDSWPGLPVPEGEVIASHSSADMHSLTIHTSQAEADALVPNLEAAGFTVTDTLDMGELKTTMLESAEYRATVGWFADEGGTVRLQYTVNAITP